MNSLRIQRLITRYNLIKSSSQFKQEAHLTPG